MSAEIVRLDLMSTLIAKGKNKGKVMSNKDYALDIKREASTFNKYVKLSEGAIWNEHLTSVHGLSANHQDIQCANKMDTVWDEFIQWFNTNIRRDEVVVLVAYNGESCDLKWLWKLTQTPRSPYCLPDQQKLYMDPLYVMRHYGGCQLNMKHSRIDSYDVSVFWSYIQLLRTGVVVNLDGAHNSLVDAKAQTDILLDPHFVSYINKTESIRIIDEIFSKTEQREMKKKVEPIRPVHSSWEEIGPDNNIRWEPTGRDTYHGSQGGGKVGPSSRTIQVIRAADSLAAVFQFMVPLTFWIQVAEWSNKYCYEDWVAERFGKDRDGNKKKRRHFVDVPSNVKDKRHCADKEKKKFKITPGYILCWIAVLILQGAHFGADKGNAARLWRAQPYGVSIPYIRNTMTRDAYVFMRQYINFCDNSKRKSKGQRGYDALFKVSYALDEMMKGMKKAWTAGKHVTIDESTLYATWAGQSATFNTCRRSRSSMASKYMLCVVHILL